MSTVFTNLGSFLSDLDREAKALVKQQNTDIKKLAFSVMREVVKNTPVDKGPLRASWSIAPNKAGDDEYTGFNLTKAESNKFAMDNMMKTDRETKAFLIWMWVIYNNKEYASYVNDGTSKQAPQKFLEKGIEEGTANWEKRKK